MNADKVDTQTRIKIHAFKQQAEADDAVTAPIRVMQARQSPQARRPSSEEVTKPIRTFGRARWLTDEDRTPTIPFLLFPRRG